MSIQPTNGQTGNRNLTGSQNLTGTRGLTGSKNQTGNKNLTGLQDLLGLVRFQIRSYFRFLWKSTNQHGVHSPFVFGLVTRCFYDRRNHPAYEMLSRYRQTLRSSGAQIEMTDLGAGSRVFNSNKRKIADIAKNAGITPKRARLLNRLVRYLEVEKALELGTSLGIGAAAMAAGNKVLVQTIEGCPATAGIAQSHFREFGLDNIQLLQGEFDEVLDELREHKIPVETREVEKIQKQSFSADRKSENWTGDTRPQVSRGASEDIGSSEQNLKDISKNQPPQKTESSLHRNQENINQDCTFSLIFFDGNHQKEATLRYFEKMLPFAHNDSVFIFDDIHWSQGMEEAWEQIKNHPSVRVSIDTFKWGMVFFRREQAKEHFVIRV